MQYCTLPCDLEVISLQCTNHIQYKPGYLNFSSLVLEDKFQYTNLPNQTIGHYRKFLQCWMSLKFIADAADQWVRQVPPEEHIAPCPETTIRFAITQIALLMNYTSLH